MFKHKSVRHLIAAVLVIVFLTMFLSGSALAFGDSTFGNRSKTTYIEPFSKTPPSWIIGEGNEPWWKNIFDKKTGFDNWGSGGSSGSKWW